MGVRGGEVAAGYPFFAHRERLARKRFSLLLAWLLLGGALACARRSEPVGRLRVAPKRIELGFPHSVALRLEWEPAAPLDRLHGHPVVFVHLLERPGRVLRTYDHRLPRKWEAGQPQSYEIDLYQSVLAEPLPAGTYLLSFGLYDDSWGYRWPLEVEGRDLSRREYSLGTVEVPRAGQQVSFAFSGGWLAVERGSDQQILARRWLKGPGAIRVSGVTTPGTVRLAMGVPDSAPGGAAGVEATSSCGEGKSEILGPGFWWVGISVGARGFEEPCEIRFQPASGASGQERVVCLEVVAWRPAEPSAGTPLQ